MLKATIIKDSISPAGVRLTTAELIFPRFILSEFNTHRVFSRNSASSRATPVHKQIRMILESPFVPTRVGLNQRGMQATKYIEGEKYDEFTELWVESSHQAIWGTISLIIGDSILEKEFGKNYRHSGILRTQEGKNKVYTLLEEYERVTREARNNGDINHDYLDIHKQHANRLIEPYMMHTVINTTTELDNFFALRNAEAQPEMEDIAKLYLEAYTNSTPTLVEYGQMHLPLLSPEEEKEALIDPNKWAKVSVGRCARTSALTHHGVRDISADLGLFERLKVNGHMSPNEHQASPLEDPNEWSGNFRGWEQFRKTFKNEDDFSKILAEKQ